MLENFWFKTPSVAHAAKVMHYGGVIAYPTEAVWGLGCDPFNQNAVENILSLKKRSIDKGLILLASRMSQLDFVLGTLSTKQLHQLESRWPGPVTWIVPTNPEVPLWVSGQHAGVAVRVSAHPYVRALCDKYGGAIISTSANPQGNQAAKTAWQVRRYFGGSPLLNYISSGCVGKRSRPSEIIDLSSNAIIRS